jgi:superfamily II DNA/RNA helicase
MVKNRENKVEEDYTVTNAHEPVMITDAEGYRRFSRNVLVLEGGRPAQGSTFALAVHQCLCVLENQKVVKADPDADPEQFVVLPENALERSSYTINTLDKYKEGRIFGVSGTARHKAPTSKKEINHEEYNYLIVPPHKKSLRENKKLFAAKDDNQGIEFITKIIQEKLASEPKQPILLVCKNDEESGRIFELIKSKEGIKDAEKNRIHALSSRDEERKAVNNAGNPGQITVSTADLSGRGVDFNADNLCVLAYGIFSREQELQVAGRTARYGKRGEFVRVVDLSHQDAKGINRSAYNLEREVRKVQDRAALKAAQQEEVAKLYARFSEEIHQTFFQNFGGRDVDQEKLIKWSDFLQSMQKDWDVRRGELLEKISRDEYDKFEQKFQEFSNDWTQRLQSCCGSQAQDLKIELRDFVSKTSTALLSEQAFFTQKNKKIIKPQRQYEVADSGQARVYSSLFVQTRAILSGERALFANHLAARENRGTRFPELKATLNGERPLFANLRATIDRWIQEIKSKLTSKNQIPRC